MSKTKIVIIQLKEIVYTAIFVGLGILLLLLLVFMFLPKNKDNVSTEVTPTYTAGVYTSAIVLNDTSLNLEVVVDSDHINSIRLVNIDDSMATMYPLLEPALDEITKQLYDGVDIDKVSFSDDSKYTSSLLQESIKLTLEKATP